MLRARCGVAERATKNQKGLGHVLKDSMWFRNLYTNNKIIYAYSSCFKDSLRTKRRNIKSEGADLERQKEEPMDFH